MTQYREILRLTAMGLPQRAILKSVKCSQKTVVKVQHRARELKISWPLAVCAAGWRQRRLIVKFIPSHFSLLSALRLSRRCPSIHLGAAIHQELHLEF